jgi:hypothetical protein
MKHCSIRNHEELGIGLVRRLLGNPNSWGALAEKQGKQAATHLIIGSGFFLRAGNHELLNWLLEMALKLPGLPIL